MIRIGRSKALGAVLLTLAAALGCTEQPADRLQQAHAILKHQLASDISIQIEQERLSEPGGAFYYVCGTAVLNQPGILDHSHERFIINVRMDGGGGMALFDGSASRDTRARFEADWKRKCG